MPAPMAKAGAAVAVRLATPGDDNVCKEGEEQRVRSAQLPLIQTGLAHPPTLLYRGQRP